MQYSFDKEHIKHLKENFSFREVYNFPVDSTELKAISKNLNKDLSALLDTMLSTYSSTDTAMSVFVDVLYQSLRKIALDKLGGDGSLYIQRNLIRKI